MKRRLFFFGSLLLGLALLAWVFAWVGVSETLAALRRAGIGASASLFVNGVAILLLQTVAWSLLLRSAGHAVPFRVLANAMLMGFAMAFVTPSMYLGGEPIRMYYVATQQGIQKRRVLGTILVQKFQELSAFLVLCWVGSAAALWYYRTALGAGGLVALVAFDVAAGAGMLALLWSFLTRAQWSVRLLRAWAARGVWGAAACGRLSADAADMEDLIHQAFVQRLPATLVSYLLMFASLALVFLRPSFFFRWLPGPNPFSLSGLGVFFVLTQLLMALQFTPGGVGLYEGGFLGVFRLLQVPGGEGLAYTAVARAVELTLTGAGVFLGVHYGLMRGFGAAEAVKAGTEEQQGALSRAGESRT